MSSSEGLWKLIDKGQWEKVTEDEVKKCPTILIDALHRKCDNETIKKILRLGASVHELDMEGLTPILIALKRNENEEFICMLLKQGSTIDAVYSNCIINLNVAIFSEISIVAIHKLLECIATMNVAKPPCTLDGPNNLKTCHTTKSPEYFASTPLSRVFVEEYAFKLSCLLLQCTPRDPSTASFYLCPLNWLFTSPLHIVLIESQRYSHLINMLIKYTARDIEKFDMFEKYLNLNLSSEYISITLKEPCLCFGRQCITELANMKKIIIDESHGTTLCDFLNAKRLHIASFKEDIKSRVLSVLVSHDLPIYRDVLLLQLGNIILKEKFMEISGRNRYSDCWYHILDFLSPEDILNLIKAF